MDDVVKKLVGGLQATNKSVVEGKVCTRVKAFVCLWEEERRRPRLKSAKGEEGARAFAEAGAIEEPT